MCLSFSGIVFNVIKKSHPGDGNTHTLRNYVTPLRYVVARGTLHTCCAQQKTWLKVA